MKSFGNVTNVKMHASIAMFMPLRQRMISQKAKLFLALILKSIIICQRYMELRLDKYYSKIIINNI